MSDSARLPRLVVGERRRWMALLVTIALVHTGFTLATALAAGSLTTAPMPTALFVVAGIAVALAGIGLTRLAERVVAERLGQDYVHELRGRVVAVALDDGRGPSLGITIARATNDLTAIRSWVAQGIAPLIVAGALVVGAVGMLAILHPPLALAAALPLAVLAGVLFPVGRATYARARRVRRLRGRLAARVADTLGARGGIVAAGGVDRELRRMTADSERVVEAAVSRSRTAGVLEGAAVAAAASIAVLIVVVGRWTDATPAAITTGLTVAGVLAASVGGIGRFVELRQNDRAARRILAPLLEEPQSVARPRTDRERPPRAAKDFRAPVPPGLVTIGGIAEGLGVAGRAGDRIRLTGRDSGRLSSLLGEIASPRRGGELTVVIDGWDQGRLPASRRRELVGLAAHGTPLERGTIGRAVRYRRPDLPSSVGGFALERVGLMGAVAQLERGDRTELRRGGEPLAPHERALLRIARAALGDPPLLLLDRVDAELDETGRRALQRLVADYPGVVVFTSDDPQRVAVQFRTITLE